MPAHGSGRPGACAAKRVNLSRCKTVATGEVSLVRTGSNCVTMRWGGKQRKESDRPQAKVEHDSAWVGGELVPYWRSPLEGESIVQNTDGTTEPACVIGGSRSETGLRVNAGDLSGQGSLHGVLDRSQSRSSSDETG